MTRRIALAFAALVAVLLVAAVLPLGAAMQSREEESFRFATISDARQLTAAAEETLDDHHAPAPMNQAVAAAARHGDCAAVFTTTGTTIAATPCGTGKDAAAITLATRATATRTQVTTRDDDWLRTATPVGDNDDTPAGTVVYARSAESLDHHVAAMWGWLALTAAACLALGAALATALARWVARPLLALDTAATHLGDGALDVRAPTDDGPPEVRRLARTFNRMAERTESLVHGHRGWIADVSHQLRTPLTALRLRLDVLVGEAAEAGAAATTGTAGAAAPTAETKATEAAGAVHAIADATGAATETEAVAEGVVSATAEAGAAGATGATPDTEAAAAAVIGAAAEAGAAGATAATRDTEAAAAATVGAAAEIRAATAEAAGAVHAIADTQAARATGPARAAAEPSPTAAAWQRPDLAVELAGVQEEIERLSRLVDGLLAVARAESVVARREAVGVDGVVAERVAAWEPLAREHGQGLVVGGVGGRAALAALAPGNLEQVLDNVIANALAAVPSGGRVRVEASAERDGRRVIVRVVDDGPGMADAAKRSAFRRFGASSGSGSGLGLAIVDRLVTANGGEVRLVDTPGGGLTVVVELPAAASPAHSSS